MQICLINGSIRPRGVSGQLAQELKLLLPEADILRWSSPENVAESRELLLAADALALFFGIYFDGLPAQLTAPLEEAGRLFSGAEKKPKVYVLVNCGYYEAANNDLALRMVRHWCDHAELPFCGGLSLGAGGGFLSLRQVPMGTGAKAELGEALAALTEEMRAGRSGEIRAVQLGESREQYFREGNEGWERAALRSGLSLQDLYRAPARPEEEKRAADGTEHML